jgi:hypothetical protein
MNPGRCRRQFFEKKIQTSVSLEYMTWMYRDPAAKIIRSLNYCNPASIMKF